MTIKASLRQVKPLPSPPIVRVWSRPHRLTQAEGPLSLPRHGERARSNAPATTRLALPAGPALQQGEGKGTDKNKRRKPPRKQHHSTAVVKKPESREERLTKRGGWQVERGEQEL